MPSIEELKSAQTARRALLSRTVATYDYLGKMISECRASEIAGEIVTAHPYVRYMTFTAYEAWGQWVLEAEDFFDTDGNSIKKQSHIRSTINDLLDIEETIRPFAPYSGQKLDLHELSMRTYV